MGSLASHATAPYLLKNPGFDPLKDFIPISLLAVAPATLIVPNDFPAQSLADFIKLVKANPGKYTYASGGIGSPPQLTAEMFKTRTGTNIVHIPYKGAPQNILDLSAGRVDSLFDTTIATVPYIKGGKAKALAVASPHRSPAIPDVPTFAEGGLPGFEVYGWYGMFAVANTPPEIVSKLNDAFVKAVAMPDVQEKFRALGMDPKGTTPQEFDALVRSENAKYAKVIRDANIQAE